MIIFSSLISISHNHQLHLNESTSHLGNFMEAIKVCSSINPPSLRMADVIRNLVFVNRWFAVNSMQNGFPYKDCGKTWRKRFYTVNICHPRDDLSSVKFSFSGSSLTHTSELLFCGICDQTTWTRTAHSKSDTTPKQKNWIFDISFVLQSFIQRQIKQ